MRTIEVGEGGGWCSNDPPPPHLLIIFPVQVSLLFIVVRPVAGAVLEPGFMGPGIFQIGQLPSGLRYASCKMVNLNMLIWIT